MQKNDSGNCEMRLGNSGIYAAWRAIAALMWSPAALSIGNGAQRVVTGGYYARARPPSHYFSDTIDATFETHRPDL